MSCSSKSRAGSARSAPQRGQCAVCCSTSAKQSGQYHWTMALNAHSTGWRRRAGGVGCAARPRRSHTTASQPRSDGRDLGNELGGASPAVAPARPAPRTPGHRRLGMLRATGRPAWDRHRRSAPSSARPDRCHGQRVATRRSWRTTTPPTVPAVETMRSPNSSSRRCERSHQPSKERRRRGLHPQVVWVDCRPAWCPAQRAPPQSAASKRGRGTIARR